MNTPRLRARVGTGEDGKFYFEMSLWDLGATKILGPPWTFGPFEDEKTAHQKMKETVKMAADKLVELEGGKPDGTYIDFKNGGITRPWAEQ